MYVPGKVFLSLNLTPTEAGYIAGILASEFETLGKESDPAVFTLAFQIRERLKARKFNEKDQTLIDEVCKDLGLINGLEPK